jgi:hypothetical protein
MTEWTKEEAETIGQLASAGRPEITAEDYRFLVFLFAVQGVQMQAAYERRDGHYFGALWKAALVYVVLYPIMFVWLAIRLIRKKIDGQL